MQDTQLIRHAYEQVVNCAARLASFSTGKILISDGPIHERQELLALDDLSGFSYHARRLIKLTKTSKRFTSINIPALSSAESSMRIDKILNIIVHHEDIEILRTELAAKIFLEKEDIIDLIIQYRGKRSKDSIPTTVIVQSDRDKVSFKLEHLIEVFQEKILSKIIEVCSDKKIYLDMDAD